MIPKPLIGLKMRRECRLPLSLSLFFFYLARSCSVYRRYLRIPPARFYATKAPGHVATRELRYAMWCADKACFVKSRGGVVQSPVVSSLAHNCSVIAYIFRWGHVQSAYLTSAPQNNGSSYRSPRRNCFLPFLRALAASQARKLYSFSPSALARRESCALDIASAPGSVVCCSRMRSLLHGESRARPSSLEAFEDWLRTMATLRTAI